MDAQTILATARSGSVPSDWNVWPLRVDRVKRGLLGWVGITLLGFVLFIPAAWATIPSNFEQGFMSVAFTLVLLGMLGALAFGGLGIALYDFWRLRHANEYLLVMTPDDFVEATPRRIIHVPMEYVTLITLRGVKTNQDIIREDQASLGAGVQRRWLTPGRREPKSAPSLAFVDARDQSEVVVATDDSFEDLIVLEQMLSGHAFAKEHRRLA